ncbi:uncharacterized PE-PGRS family protein PE_PGRS54 [Danio aesculapii]|uniref:uncharacterized PE-PGRS family protein PE_PGRS54 n=1 Tax=Danio aesculapii TaxID=1142201 RepID=UPI0024C0A2FB|nr:uncharacterized PE-PGRS family protein PE_PGRS54 [Danio aesculapii]
MLLRNLVIASVAVVFLVSSVSAAPVEDKEPEENDFEAEEGEEELSEEEEDDDDSKGQHMKGAGSQQATTAPKGLGLTPGSGVAGESPNGHKLNGGTQTGQVSSSSTSTASGGANGGNGRDGYSHSSGSSSQDASYDGQDGSKSEIVPPGVGAGGAGANGGSGSKVPGTEGGVHSVSISIVSSGQGSSGHISAGHESVMSSSQTSGRPSAGQTPDAAGVVSSEVQSQPAGSEGFSPQYENGETSQDGSQIEPPEIPETESNGNGHKQLLNGGETGFTGLDHFMAGTSQMQGTGGFDSFGASPHLAITGVIDQSSHDFLVGLMGGLGESFGPDTQTDGLDHMGLAFQVDSAAAGVSPGQSSSGGPVLDTPPDSAGPDYLSADNGNGDYSHSVSTSDNGAPSKLPADTTDSSVVLDTASHPAHSFIDYSDGGADNNGADNGADSHDTNGNGNGRHKPVVDVQKGDPSGTHLDLSGAGAETHHTAGDQHTVSSHSDAVGALGLSDHTLSPYADTTGHDGVTGAGGQTDMAGAAGEPVTDGQAQTDLTGQGHLAVTDGMPNYTDSVHATGTGFTDASETHSIMVQTDLPVTGGPFTAGSSQTDAMGTGQPGATEQTQPAVSAGEQYHTSGQGPEGAENVELEDTC